jgi:hypothetical protein
MVAGAVVESLPGHLALGSVARRAERLKIGDGRAAPVGKSSELRERIWDGLTRFPLGERATGNAYAIGRRVLGFLSDGPD